MSSLGLGTQIIMDHQRHPSTHSLPTAPRNDWMRKGALLLHPLRIPSPEEECCRMKCKRNWNAMKHPSLEWQSSLRLSPSLILPMERWRTGGCTKRRYQKWRCDWSLSSLIHMCLHEMWDLILSVVLVVFVGMRVAIISYEMIWYKRMPFWIRLLTIVYSLCEEEIN